MAHMEMWCLVLEYIPIVLIKHLKLSVGRVVGRVIVGFGLCRSDCCCLSAGRGDKYAPVRFGRRIRLCATDYITRYSLVAVCASQ
jgi:hypothetical protein